MVEYQRRVAEIVRKDPDVQAFVSTIGGAGRGDPRAGRISVSLSFT